MDTVNVVMENRYEVVGRVREGQSKVESHFIMQGGY